MEAWRKIWREGIAPQLGNGHLQVLRAALLVDDPRLLQGAATSPPPLQCVQDWPVEAACVLGYCGWQGEELKTVAEVETYFAKACFNCDQLMGESAMCRWFLNWFDDTPRPEMRRLLLAEIDATLAHVKQRIPYNGRLVLVCRERSNGFVASQFGRNPERLRGRLHAVQPPGPQTLVEGWIMTDAEIMIEIEKLMADRLSFLEARPSRAELKKLLQETQEENRRLSLELATRGDLLIKAEKELEEKRLGNRCLTDKAQALREEVGRLKEQIVNQAKVNAFFREENAAMSTTGLALDDHEKRIKHLERFGSAKPTL